MTYQDSFTRRALDLSYSFEFLSRQFGRDYGMVDVADDFTKFAYSPHDTRWREITCDFVRFALLRPHTQNRHPMTWNSNTVLITLFLRERKKEDTVRTQCLTRQIFHTKEVMLCKQAVLDNIVGSIEEIEQVVRIVEYISESLRQDSQYCETILRTLKHLPPTEHEKLVYKNSLAMVAHRLYPYLVEKIEGLDRIQQGSYHSKVEFKYKGITFTVAQYEQLGTLTVIDYVSSVYILCLDQLSLQVFCYI